MDHVSTLRSLAKAIRDGTHQIPCDTDLVQASQDALFDLLCEMGFSHSAISHRYRCGLKSSCDLVLALAGKLSYVHEVLDFLQVDNGHQKHFVNTLKRIGGV